MRQCSDVHVNGTLQIIRWWW